MSLNRIAAALLGDADAIVILYDSTSRSVGLRPASKRMKHAYPLSKHAAGVTISARAFAKYYGIDVSRTRSFDPIFEDGVLIFDLDKGYVSGRNRSG